MTYAGKRPVIADLDVVKINRIFESGVVPVQVTHPFVNGGIAIANRADVALELANIDRVKSNLARSLVLVHPSVSRELVAYNCGEEPHIRLCERVSYQVVASAIGEMLLNPVQGFE